ncbi:unnamed protein product, partial [Rotaria sp. Silwood2]
MKTRKEVETTESDNNIDLSPSNDETKEEGN